MLYTENPKDSTKKPSRVINELRKGAGYEIKIRKSVAVLYKDDELAEREIKETVYSCTKKNKIPRKKLNQGGGISGL